MRRDDDKWIEQREAAGLCMWFALCERPATGTTPHPILGDVPTCDRCHQFATGFPREVDVHSGGPRPLAIATPGDLP